MTWLAQLFAAVAAGVVLAAGLAALVETWWEE